MSFKVLYKILGIVILSIIILGVLKGTTVMPNEKDNGFNRNWKSNEGLELERSMKFDEPLSTIAGISKNTIFLAGDNATAILLIDKKSFKRKDTLMIQFHPDPTKIVPFSIRIDTPYYFVQFVNLRAYLYGKFPNENIKLKEKAELPFTKSIQIDSSKVILRMFNQKGTGQDFAILDLESMEVKRDTDYVKMYDKTAGMSTDGSFTFDKETKRIFFVEYFRNKFYCMDTSISLQYIGKTIDTVATSRIELKSMEKNDTTIKLVSAAARLQVNKDCFAGEGLLYILSGMRASNETIKDFNSHFVIDYYDQKDGKYLGTVKIPKMEDRKYKSIYVKDGRLYVLYENEFRSYLLPQIKN
ncbi:hypothetical protein ACQKLP_08255 [Chitinophaga sp. NPDC101104]|uniref:hypothetical protein n=1 Tax=Chitinophaga sp. NPDC101104 TaxID=3390561 RepID=UPI003CFD105F